MEKTKVDYALQFLLTTEQILGLPLKTVTEKRKRKKGRSKKDSLTQRMCCSVFWDLEILEMPILSV